MRAALIAGLLVAAPLAACAQAPTEADQIREELRQLKQEYQERFERLEKRLRGLESQSVPAPTTNVSAALASAVKAESPGTAMDATGTNAVRLAREFANKEFQAGKATREGVAETQVLQQRVEQVLQDFIEFHGYFRAGYGRDDQGGAQVGFMAPGAFAKYRLGNEAENYGELTLGKNFYVPDLFSLDSRERPDGTPTGPVARVQTTISVFNPYQDLLSSGDTDFGLPEVFASVGNVVAAQPSLKFWAGSRYYRRYDIHINDFFFYNMSGTGGGIEDLELPFGKLAVAYIGGAATSGFSDLPQPDPENQAGFSKANYDMRLYDVPLPLGKGEFGLVYSRADSGKDAEGRSAPGSQGGALTFLHSADRFLRPDGVNRFSLQFGTGAAKTFTSGFETMTTPNGLFIRPDDDRSWRFRATEHFIVDLDDHFSIGPALVYQISDYADHGGVVQWTSAGVRPILRLNKYISLAFEGGVDWVKDSDAGTSDYLYKLTLAPQVSLGSRFFSRPAIRAFITYAHWGDDFRGQVGGKDYVDENQGLTYGVQMEAWW